MGWAEEGGGGCYGMGGEGGCNDHEVRPSLSEKTFPVCRVTAKKASWEVGILFFFLFLID